VVSGIGLLVTINARRAGLLPPDLPYQRSIPLLVNLVPSIASIISAASLAMSALAAMSLVWPGYAPATASPPASADILCNVQWVHDGETLRSAGYRKSSRLYGIDAPEMPGACR
jgi:endonuclease YncB( thermonuclease family)